MSRLLGVDLGDRRIGLAMGDTETRRARPLATIRRAPTTTDDAAAIRRTLGGITVAEVVLGLPLEMGSGDEGPQARATRTWGEAIEAELSVPVTFRDERLTSHVAEERVGRMPRGRSGGPPTARQRDAHRARVDREAAAVILQDELDARLAAASALRDGVVPNAPERGGDPDVSGERHTAAIADGQLAEDPHEQEAG